MKGQTYTHLISYTSLLTVSFIVLSTDILIIRSQLQVQSQLTKSISWKNFETSGDSLLSYVCGFAGNL